MHGLACLTEYKNFKSNSQLVLGMEYMGLDSNPLGVGLFL